jgi:hypothetical protein
VRTPTFGDVQNFPARVRAGSASPSGGIQPNDEYPAAVALVSQLQPATVSNLPYLLWEGELSEIHGVVMLSPAIWKADEDDRLVPYIAQFHAAAASNVPYRNQFQPYVPWTTGGGGVASTWNPMRSCPTPLGDGAKTLFVPTFSGYRDEPIDVNPDHSYCPMWVAINWKVASSLTSVNTAAVVEIPFTSTVHKGEYRLYLRVERVP